MSNVEKLNGFLQRITSDGKLTTTHIGICTALLLAWIKNGLKNPINVSRKGLMAAARIKSTTTYHKVIADLASLNYVKYEPSYHPGKGSQVHILFEGYFE
jgi:hypothetical protein